MIIHPSRTNPSHQVDRAGCDYFPYNLTCADDKVFVAAHDYISVRCVQTLNELYRIGEGAFEVATDCAVAAGALHVADAHTPGKLHVFDLDGANRRTLCGDFGVPNRIHYRDGLLLLLEHDGAYELPHDAPQVGEAVKRVAARRP